LAQTAMHLTRHNHRVEDISKVINSGQTVDAYFACFRVQLDFATIRTRRVGKVCRVIERRFFQARFDVFERELMRDISFESDFTEGNRFIGPCD